MMSELIKITKKNEVFGIIECDSGIQLEIQDHFSFMVNGARHMPKFKAGIWDGRIRLFNLVTKEFPLGLFNDLVEFCKARDYEIEYGDSPYGIPNEKNNISAEAVQEFVNSLQCTGKDGKVLEIRDFQYVAVYEALLNKRKVLLASTGAGKSLIAYCIIRWLVESEMRVMLVVPTKSLVLQMLKDFVTYSQENEFDVEENTHIIMGGLEKKTKKSIVITTWQSIQKMPSEYFQQYDAVMVDEVHGAKGTMLQGILSKCTESAHRIGMTGSLDNSEANSMLIKAMFGDITRVTSTKKLMDDGHLTPISIKAILLDYSDETKELCKKFDYQREIDFICQHEKRNKFIRNLALSLDGNSLVLYNYVEKHGKVIYDLIKAKADPERKIFFVHGGVEAEDREAIRHIVEENNNAIIVASLGTFSTGININRLHNVIFASPTKSVIRVLQSIGRGLRLSEDKKVFNLFDIADNLAKSTKKKNFTYKHLLERLSIYHKEDFQFKIIDVNLE